VLDHDHQLSVEAVIFDLDGTLIDSEPTYEKVDQEFVLSKGVLFGDTSWGNFAGIGGRAFVSRMKEEFGLSGDIDSLVAEKDELFMARADSVTPFPGVLELVRYLYVHAIPMAIATSSRRVVLDTVLSHTGLDRYFQITLSTDDVRYPKPDPEIYLMSSRLLGVEPASCLVLEDSRYGVAAATAAGMQVVALPAADQDLSYFESASVIVDGGAARLDPHRVVERFGLAVPPAESTEVLQQVVARFHSVVYEHAALNPRPMPWRQTRDPYHILVSEFMLQQTQVSRVIPRYHAFLRRFPTVESLASASVSEVLTLWQGLGYNRRGKFLLEAARQVVGRHGGLVPGETHELRALPGVGAYTASAVAAFAFLQPSTVVETNIRRVVLHYFFAGCRGVAERSVEEVVAHLVDREDPRRWYYALMDYGSFLAAVVPNANRRSARYTVQSRFEGSLRQVRGQIVRALTRAAPLDLRELEREIGPTDERFERAIQSLKADGMLGEDRRGFFLP